MNNREQARQLIHGARRVVALTGAGVSAESGIPTFRGPGGLFEEHQPEDLATPEAFSADPARVWRFYRWRREIVRAAQPNAGHLALGVLARRGRLQLVTQNVDGLHQRGGVADPIELHGNLLRSRCHDCGERPTQEPADEVAVPRCEVCGGGLRPDVVWFGEGLPAAAWRRAESAVEEADMFLLLGTSAVVYPAATLPQEALRRGCPVVEVNPEPTPLSDQVTLRVAAATGECLPVLLGTT